MPNEKRRILAIEDKPNFKASLKRWLSTNYQLQVVDDFDQAKSLIQGGEFDLLIVNLNLHDEDSLPQSPTGFELLRFLAEKHPLKPSIVWSGNPDYYTFELHKQANDVLTYGSVCKVFSKGGTKPIKKEVFIQAIEDAMNKYKKAVDDTKKKKTVDFAIVTALPEEFSAVVEKFSAKQEIRGCPYHAYSAQISMKPSGDLSEVVVACQAQMGQANAAALAMSLSERYQFRYVLLVGIAGGKRGKVKLGDVIVANQIVDGSEGELENGRRIPRWKSPPVNPLLLNSSKIYESSTDLSNHWRDYIKKERPEPGHPMVHHAPVFSSCDVIKDDEVTDEYQQTWKKAIGIEMEGGGVAMTVFNYITPPPGFLMIRGVSDLADANKSSEEIKKWRLYACDVAASYTYAFLENGSFLR